LECYFPISTLSRRSSFIRLFCRLYTSLLYVSFAAFIRLFCKALLPPLYVSFVRLFCRVPIQRDQLDWDWGIWLQDTANAIGYTVIRATRYTCTMRKSPIFHWKSPINHQKNPIFPEQRPIRLRLGILIAWHFKCNRLYRYPSD